MKTLPELARHEEAPQSQDNSITFQQNVASWSTKTTRHPLQYRFLFDKAGLAPRDCQSDYLEMLDLGRSIKKQTDKSDILLSPLSVENHLLLRLRNECDSFGFAFVSSHHAGQAS
jgi:hypothetical protein